MRHSVTFMSAIERRGNGNESGTAPAHSIVLEMCWIFAPIPSLWIQYLPDTTKQISHLVTAAHGSFCKRWMRNEYCTRVYISRHSKTICIHTCSKAKLMSSSHCNDFPLCCLLRRFGNNSQYKGGLTTSNDGRHPVLRWLIWQTVALLVKPMCTSTAIFQLIYAKIINANVLNLNEH